MCQHPRGVINLRKQVDVVKSSRDQGSAPYPAVPDGAFEVMRAAHLEPLEPFPGDRKPWRCRCDKCGSEVSPQYYRVKNGRSCRFCANKATTDRLRERKAEAAVELMRSVGLEPLEPYPGAHQYWRCRCGGCGDEVSPHYASITQGGRGCRKCASAKNGARRRTPAEEAVEAMRAAGLEPLEPFPGGRTPWRCRCKRCECEVSPRLYSIKYGQGGCRYCSRSGFRGDAEANVYLLDHSVFGALKVGISGLRSRRLRSHTLQGWRVVFLLAVPGTLAVEIEKSILDWWRNDLGLPPYLSKYEIPQGGWTETVDVEAVSIPEVIRRIRLLAGLHADDAA